MTPVRRKGAAKKCCYGTCKSDTRYKKSFNKDNTYFINFPKPCLEYRKKKITKSLNIHIKTCSECAKCNLWVKKCERSDGRFSSIDDVNKDTYICSLHFYEKNGPTEINPHPLRYREFEKIGKSINKISMAPEEVDICDNNLQEIMLPVQSPSRNILHRDTNNEEINKIMRTTGTQTIKMKNSALEKYMGFIYSDDKKCIFYTGLIFEQIQALHRFLSPACESLDYGHRQQSTNISSGNDKNKLTSMQQLFLILLRLRMGYLTEDLACQFDISVGLVSKTCTAWIYFLYNEFSTHLKPLMFPSRKTIAETLPKVFRSIKNIRVIVDSAEFFCQSPTNFEHQGNLYSSYKAHTTFKVLIGCTPNGCVSFASDAFEGSISDPEIFKQSKIADLLQPGDVVLADRGFTVHDLVEAKQAHLKIPPFLNGRDRLTPQEEMLTKKIAKQRIYVEHVIGRIKNFRLLQTILPLNMRTVISQIIFVCVCLVNFQAPIVFDE